MAKKKEKFNFDKLADQQAERILKKLNKTEPGTKEYRELQNQLGAYEIMKEKRRSGKLSKSEWTKYVLDFLKTTIGLGIVLTADALLPRVIEKLKLQEIVTRMFK